MQRNCYQRNNRPATANGDKSEQNESKPICDNACTQMKERVDEASQVYVIPKSKYFRYITQNFKDNILAVLQ